MDTGEIVLQSAAPSIPAKHTVNCTTVWRSSARDLLGARSTLRRQGALTARAAEGEPSVTRPIAKDGSRDRLGWPAQKIVDHVRAYSPQPAARARNRRRNGEDPAGARRVGRRAGVRRTGRTQSRKDERRRSTRARWPARYGARDERARTGAAASCATFFLRLMPGCGSAARRSRSIIVRGARARSARSRLRNGTRLRRHQDAARPRLVFASRLSGERMHVAAAVSARYCGLAVYELAYTRADAHATVFEFVNLAKRYGHRGLANLVNAVLRNMLARTVGGRERNASTTRTSISQPAIRYRTGWCGSGGSPSASESKRLRGSQRPGTERAIVANAVARIRRELPSRIDASRRRSGRSPISSRSRCSSSAEAHERGRSNARRQPWWTTVGEFGDAGRRARAAAGEAVLDAAAGAATKRCRSARAWRRPRRPALHRARRAQKRDAYRPARTGRHRCRDRYRRRDRGDTAADQGFDRILVDAPCSGIGVVGRHPEARWKKQAGDGERLA